MTRSFVYLTGLFFLIIPSIHIIPTYWPRVVVETVDLLSHPIKKVGIVDLVSEKDIRCLADNIFYEAGNQSDEGKTAVAFVTINRLFSSHFPNSICAIVYQKLGSVCQFSWVCQTWKLAKRKEREPDVWLRSYNIAKQIIEQYHEDDDPTQGALFFHASYVKPKWSKKYVITTKINDHIFYRPDNGI